MCAPVVQFSKGGKGEGTGREALDTKSRGKGVNSEPGCTGGEEGSGALLVVGALQHLLLYVLHALAFSRSLSLPPGPPYQHVFVLMS